MDKNTVLMTGDMGIVGLIIIPRLKEMGFEIDGYDIQRGDDILNTELLTKKLKGKDACIHLAGIPGPRDCPWKDFQEQNINGTLSVIKACKDAGVKKIVYMSSGAVYGFSKGSCVPDELPMKETNSLPKELGQYDMSKIECERHLEDAYSEYGITAIALRMDTPVPGATIFESHLFVSVSHYNLAEAFRAALQSDFVGYGAFNIGDEYIDKSIKIDIQKFIKDKWPNIVNNLKGRKSLWDISKAKKILGYNPK